MKKFIELKAFAKMAGVSTKTVVRKRNKDLSKNKNVDLYVMKRPQKYSVKLLEHYLSPYCRDILDENKMLKNIIKEDKYKKEQLRRTIKCFNEKGTLQHHLSQLDWTYFVTISYAKTISKSNCFDCMHRVYNDLVKIKNSTDVRMFFTTEQFANRTGFHNHVILKFENGKNFVEEFFRKNTPRARIDVQLYNNELAGVFYICKEGLGDEDWDLMGTNLKKDGDSLELMKKNTNN